VRQTTFNIDKTQVYEAYKAVKSNRERLAWTVRRSSSSKSDLKTISTRSGTG